MPRPTAKKRSAGGKRGDLSSLGLFGMDPDNLGLDDDGDLSDGGDSDLERELAAITMGGGRNPGAKARPKGGIPPVVADLDAMVAASLRDIPSDEEEDVDENDPDLLSELQDLAGDEEEVPAEEEEEAPKTFLPTSDNTRDTIKTRIEMYMAAEKSAQAAGESSRARRYNRGLKTLKDLLKQVEAGKSVNPDDIPPEVSVKPVEPKSPDEPPPVPVRTAPPTPKMPDESPSPPKIPAPSPPAEAEQEAEPEDPRMTLLNKRKEEFKKAALEAKRAGNNEMAIKYIKTVKQFDTVIQALKEGQEIDLSNMPSLTQMNDEPPKESPKKEEAETQSSSDTPAAQPAAPPMPKTVAEALQQRLEKYKAVEAEAKEEGNASKARRMGRIVKQYEDAVKMHRAGKPIPVDDLPTPPGYPPIPIDGPPKPAAAAPPPVAPKPSSSGVAAGGPSPPKPSPEQSRVSGNMKNTSLMDKQIAFLLQRQREFRQAALEAKQAGEMDEAKEYLRIFKGLEKLLDTARGGFPIDMATVPIPPSQRAKLEDGFTVVEAEDATPHDADDVDIWVRLEEQLAKQLMMCKNTRDHNRQMGDVAGTNRFENLALIVQKDLDFVRLAHKKNLPLPKFHYERRSFNIVQCNTDLAENEVEIQVVRGVGYHVANPRDVDTYVKVEFPWPQEDPFKAKTPVVKDTDSPEYEQKYLVEIARQMKACQRIFKRQVIKFEVYSKGGFLRSDTLIGTANVKIQPLETTIQIHDSFPLMDGRKAAGGKLEVKVRVRNPILTKQMEQINEKWLVIDT